MPVARLQLMLMLTASENELLNGQNRGASDLRDTRCLCQEGLRVFPGIGLQTSNSPAAVLNIKHPSRRGNLKNPILE